MRRDQHLFNIFVHLAFNIDNFEMHPASLSDFTHTKQQFFFIEKSCKMVLCLMRKWVILITVMLITSNARCFQIGFISSQSLTNHIRAVSNTISCWHSVEGIDSDKLNIVHCKSEYINLYPHHQQVNSVFQIFSVRAYQQRSSFFRKGLMH